MALDAFSETIIAIGRTVLEFNFLTPRRRGKLCDSFSRTERIECIYVWREAGQRYALLGLSEDRRKSINDEFQTYHAKRHTE